MQDITIKTFDALSVDELYQILRLRSQVFVVEQQAIYNDLDDLDYESIHYFIKENGRIVSYLRTLKRGLKFTNGASIGRIVSDIDARKNGYARRLINLAIKDIFNIDSVIIIEGQAYLKTYYESFGFEVISDIFQLDGIDHYVMQLNKNVSLK